MSLPTHSPIRVPSHLRSVSIAHPVNPDWMTVEAHLEFTHRVDFLDLFKGCEDRDSFTPRTPRNLGMFVELVD